LAPSGPRQQPNNAPVPCGLGRQDSDHIPTSCPCVTKCSGTPCEPDYRRILSQGPLVKKASRPAARFVLSSGQFRTPPTILPSLSQRLVCRISIRLQSGTVARWHLQTTQTHVSPSGRRAYRRTPCTKQDLGLCKHSLLRCWQLANCPLGPSGNRLIKTRIRI
jgi:hypothetical protein